MLAVEAWLLQSRSGGLAAQKTSGVIQATRSFRPQTYARHELQGLPQPQQTAVRSVHSRAPPVNLVTCTCAADSAITAARRMNVQFRVQGFRVSYPRIISDATHRTVKCLKVKFVQVAVSRSA